ncbi:MAG: sodium-translocating pyrophosphatase, partial [Planctomycetota bacterium]
MRVLPPAIILLVFTPVLAGEVSDAAAVEVTRPDIPPVWWIAPVGAIIALIFAFKFFNQVKNSNQGDPEMIEIADHVSQGAMAYLKRQYSVVTIVFIVLASILAFMAFKLQVQNGIVPFAFLTGGFFSGLCGFLGMKTATMASNRTTAGARESLNQGLQIAFRAGAVMGLVVVGFALIDITGWFLILYMLFEELHLSTITVIMLTFGMGASTQALFARVGGGIYTKAADVGADLVGKVEAGIPEDDPRNPATIADNVGDNVGDVAGMGADLYESYCGSILATAALGVAAAAALFGSEITPNGAHAAIRFLAAPMVLAGFGILLSIAGIYMVKSEEKATMAVLMKALNKGIWGSSILIAIAAGVVCRILLGDIEDVCWYGVWGSILSGLIGGLIIGYSTEYYTSYDYKPTKELSAQGVTGPATLIIGGIAEGMKSTWAALATIIVAILLAYTFAGGGHEFMLGLYGVGIAAVGMLATLGITLATDAYGPIADNAGGNAEMTGQQPHVRERTDALDSLGNTTAATGKGFAIGSAALTALALLAAYVEEVRIGQIREARDRITQVIESPNPDLARY